MKSRIIEVNGVELTCYEDGSVEKIDGRSRKLVRSFGGDDGLGYCQMNIGGRNIRVHRLIAQAFLPDWREDWHVDHDDMRKSNNWEWNLRMMSPKDHLSGHSRMGGRKSPIGGTGSLKWVDGLDDIYYEKKLDGFAYLFKHEDGMAYGGYFKTAEQAKESCEARKQELG